MVSIMKRKYERQRSISPILIMSQNAGAYNNEQAEGSWKQSSNVDVMEMLSKMEHNMKERDSQLKAQINERNLYFEAEIRKRDHFLDGAIKQRDLELKQELKQRYQMWSEELQSRDEAYWQEQTKRDNDLARILEGRDNDIMHTMSNKDQLWLNSLKSFTDHLKTISDFQLDLRESMEALAQKQEELLKGNDSMVVPMAIPSPLEHSSQEQATPLEPIEP